MNKIDTADALKQPQQLENAASDELTEMDLENVSGGVKRAVFGGDDDLEDLEVER